MKNAKSVKLIPQSGLGTVLNIDHYHIVGVKMGAGKSTCTVTAVSATTNGSPK